MNGKHADFGTRRRADCVRYGCRCTSHKADKLDAEQEAAIANMLHSITEANITVWEELDIRRPSEYHADDFSYYPGSP